MGQGQKMEEKNSKGRVEVYREKDVMGNRERP